VKTTTLVMLIHHPGHYTTGRFWIVQGTVYTDYIFVLSDPDL